jgi:hypothetical protein
LRSLLVNVEAPNAEAAIEVAAKEAFPSALTRADHIARMDRLIDAKDFGAAMRAAKRLGDGEVAIVKGCRADGTSSKGGALLAVDEVFLDLSDRITPQLGPIPRNY